MTANPSDSARDGRPSSRQQAGFTILEMAVSLMIFAVGLLGVILVINVSLRELALAKENGAARLATGRVVEVLTAVRIRAQVSLATNDNPTWLFQGGYEIARTAAGTSVVMPDLRTVATVNEYGIGGWVRAEFPVPGLTPVTPNAQSNVGKILFHIDETLQSPSGVTLPTVALPFPPTPGFQRLDCDGDGAFTTSNLRAAHDTAATRCRLIPVRIRIEWRSDTGRTEFMDTPVLLVQNGL